jgi:hypothetical protein
MEELVWTDNFNVRVDLRRGCESDFEYLFLVRTITMESLILAQDER